MRTQEEVQKFIQFRADGLAYEKIAVRMGISKWTLINWGKKYESEIAELKSERLEALQEQYCISVESKVKMWGRIVNDLKAELDNSRLRKVAPDKLFNMLLKAQAKLEQVYVDPKPSSSENEPFQDTQDEFDVSEQEQAGPDHRK